MEIKYKDFYYIKYFLYYLFFQLLPVPVVAVTELTLEEVESIALQSDPAVSRFQSRQEALSERAVAEGQLPDPELSFGLAEIPLNNFDLGDHEDTEVRVGLSQEFPPGKTLKFKSDRMIAMSGIEQALAANQRLLVLNEVRDAYIQLYFQMEMNRILELNRDLFTEMTEITERQYAEGRDNQHDVVRAQLELSLVEDRLVETQGSIDISREKLAKWISAQEAIRPLSKNYPELPALATEESIINNLPDHPLLAVEDAQIEVAQKSVAIANEQYKPKWMIDFMLTENTASQFDLQTGPDFAGVFFKMSLPIFADKRQDRKLAASKHEAMAARYNRADSFRELLVKVKSENANYRRLERRLQLYKQRASVEAMQTEEATFDAYQNDLVDFETLIRARVLSLQTELEMLRIQRDQLQSQIRLLYLAGDQS